MSDVSSRSKQVLRLLTRKDGDQKNGGDKNVACRYDKRTVAFLPDEPFFAVQPFDYISVR